MRSLVLLAVLALSACSFGPTCQRYGFVKGTPAYAQCIQAEELGVQQRAAILLAK